MGFLRRMLGGHEERPADSNPAERPGDSNPAGRPPDAHWPGGIDDHLPDDEVERERAMLRAEAARLDDDLIQRQLRYADRSWTPPRQGGDVRADDEKPES